MPELHISIDQDKLDISFEPGAASVKDLLDQHGITLPSHCGGVGKCGLCMVRIESGACSPLSLSEQSTLTAEEIKQGGRLACQVKPLADISLSIHKADNPTAWAELDSSGSTGEPSASDAHGQSNGQINGLNYGLAIDLGTTQIRATLWNLERNSRIDGITELNPQAKFGADVLSRLAAAKSSTEQAEQLSQLARDAVGEAVQILTSRHNLPTSAIKAVTIVANTAMLALFAGRNYEHLLELDYWQKPVDYPPEPDHTQAWAKAWGVDAGSTIELVQPLAGFVGSDLLAGILSTNLMASEDAALLIDFGTNSEVALWDGSRLWVTSAAGGPAFEGSGLSCGMPMMQGAIYKISAGSGDEDAFEFDVLGGGTASGICGSGLVDAIACLLKQGKLNMVGRLAEPFAKEGIPLDRSGSIRIRNGDIDLFQRAKGATGAAIAYLLEQSGLQPDMLKRVCITGAFGSGLDCHNAAMIGLIPDVTAEIIELHSDHALCGCEMLLLAPEKKRELACMRQQARLINMSLAAEFDMLFVDKLFLKPL